MRAQPLAGATYGECGLVTRLCSADPKRAAAAERQLRACSLVSASMTIQLWQWVEAQATTKLWGQFCLKADDEAKSVSDWLKHVCELGANLWMICFTLPKSVAGLSQYAYFD